MRLEAILAHHAARRPTHPALICGEARIDYATLAASVERLAAALHARGVTSGDRVLLALPNGIGFVQLAYAAFRLGAIVAPVTDRLAPAELAHIAIELTPKVIAYDAMLRPVAGALVAPPAFAVVTGQPSGNEIALAALLATDAPAAGPAAGDDALVLYTSGTTGRPKGAILTHANMIVQNMFMHGLAWRIGADDRFLVMTALAHRAGLARLFNALGLGGTLVALARFDIESAIATIERERITMTGLVPTVLRMMLPALRANPARVASLRVIAIGTEACPAPLRAALREVIPHAEIHSVYAMTEALVTDITGAEQDAHPDSVGRPLPWVEVKLVDAAGAPVAAGEPGEILVKSGAPGAFAVLRGYYDRPRESAEALADGWFHTGDIGRQDAGGFLTIVDRKKDMVISGGFNIYSKEVEQALMTHAAVAEAAVVGVPDPVYGEAVVAFVQPAPGAAPDAAMLIEHCRTLLAGYKKPRHVLVIEALPKNASGKVIKAALRAVARDRLLSGGGGD